MSCERRNHYQQQIVKDHFTIFLWNPVFTEWEFCHLNHQVVGEGGKSSSPVTNRERVTSKISPKKYLSSLLSSQTLCSNSCAVKVGDFLSMNKSLETRCKGDIRSYYFIRLAGERERGRGVKRWEIGSLLTFSVCLLQALSFLLPKPQLQLQTITSQKTSIPN